MRLVLGLPLIGPTAAPLTELRALAFRTLTLWHLLLGGCLLLRGRGCLLWTTLSAITAATLAATTVATPITAAISAAAL